MPKHTVKRKSHIILEVCCIAAAALVVLYLLHRHTPTILDYVDHDDISGLTAYIRREGDKGEFVLLILQIVETLSIVLPALPVYICSGIVYGRVKGILMCYITNLAINAALFQFARRSKLDFSKRLNYGKNPKVEELIKGVKQPDKAVLFMSLLPVMPNGTIPYVAAGTSVTFTGFMRALAVGCLPSIALNVICGDALLTVNWRVFLPVIAVLAAAAAIVFCFRKKLAARFGPRIRQYIDSRGTGRK